MVRNFNMAASVTIWLIIYVYVKLLVTNPHTQNVPGMRLAVSTLSACTIDIDRLHTLTTSFIYSPPQEPDHASQGNVIIMLYMKPAYSAWSLLKAITTKWPETSTFL